MYELMRCTKKTAVVQEDSHVFDHRYKLAHINKNRTKTHYTSATKNNNEIFIFLRVLMFILKSNIFQINVERLGTANALFGFYDTSLFG